MEHGLLVSPTRRLASITLAIAVAFSPVVISLPVASGADAVIATLAVGRSPSAVAVNPLTHMAYVTNYYGDTVSVIDGSGADTVAATLSTQYNFNLAIPNAVVVNALASPPRAYTANFWANTISVIDEESLTVTATVPADGVHAGGPRALAINPAGGKLYVANYGSGVVTVLDTETYDELASITVGIKPRALGIFVSGPRTRVFVANRESNSVSIIDGDTDTVVKTVAVGAAPKSIAVDSSTGYAYVTCESANVVTVIDDSDDVTATIPVGVRPVGVGVDTIRGRVFVANNGSGTVHVARTSDLTREATLTVEAQPWAVAVDEGDGKVYVTNYGSGSISVIDDALAVSSVGVGTSPYGVAVNEGISPHKVYATNWGSSTVSVIDDAVLGPGSVSSAVGDAAGTAIRAMAAPQDPVEVTVDQYAGDVTHDRTPVLTGTAHSMRSPYYAAVVAVFYRVDGAVRWTPATITGGRGTPEVTWEAAITERLDFGTHAVEVIAIDETGAAASVAEGATSVKTSSAGGSGAYSFLVSGPLHLDSLSARHGAPGTEVTFSGVGFGAAQGSSRVVFAGTTAEIVRWSDAAIIARVPEGASAGYAGVVVNGATSNGIYFVPFAKPALTGMTPSRGAPGTLVTFVGTGFGSDQGRGWVTFAGTPGEVVSWSDTMVQALVPSGAKAGYAGIVQNGMASNGRYFVPFASPVVTSLSARAAVVGSSVTLRGTDLGATPGQVIIAGVRFLADYWSDTEVRFTVPPSVRSGYAGVVAKGMVSNGIYIAVAPRLSTLSSWWAAPGSQVTVTGSGFGSTPGTYRVKVGGTEATQIVSWSENSVTFVVPTGARSGYVGIGTAEASSNGLYLVVETRATVLGVSPNPVAAGGTITLTGMDFGAAAGTNRVIIGGRHVCGIVSWSDTEIVATVPVTATTGYVGVYKQGVPSNGAWLGVYAAGSSARRHR